MISAHMSAPVNFQHPATFVFCQSIVRIYSHVERCHSYAVTFVILSQGVELVSHASTPIVTDIARYTFHRRWWWKPRNERRDMRALSYAATEHAGATNKATTVTETSAAEARRTPSENAFLLRESCQHSEDCTANLSRSHLTGTPKQFQPSGAEADTAVENAIHAPFDRPFI